MKVRNNQAQLKSPSDWKIVLATVCGALFFGPHSTLAIEVNRVAICDSVQNKWKVVLHYRAGEGERIILPRYLGHTAAGNEILNAWQFSGFSETGKLPGFRSFRMDRTTQIEFTRETVPYAPPVSGRLPSGMVEVVCRPE